MKMTEVADVIKTYKDHMKRPKGYRVHFEKFDGKFLTTDYFPESNEPLIHDEDDAWTMALQFAEATTGRCLNIYVVDQDWNPVPGYTLRKIENRK